MVERMTTLEILERLIERMNAHAAAWRASASQIKQRYPAAADTTHERQRAITMEHLANQLDQITTWALTRLGEVEAQAAQVPEDDGTLFAQGVQNRVTGEVTGPVVQCRDIPGGLSL